MKTISFNSENLLSHAISILKDGGIIVFPTDTAYGLGVDATNANAIEKLIECKGREFNKPFHVVVADMKMAENYVWVTEDAQLLAEAFLPGRLTIILKHKESVPNILLGGGDTIGIRIPKNKIALDIVRIFGKPITATSANKSGGETPYSIEDVMQSFGSGIEMIDLVIDAGELSKTPVSTLVDMTGSEPMILREGPVSREDILKVLK